MKCFLKWFCLLKFHNKISEKHSEFVCSIEVRRLAALGYVPTWSVWNKLEYYTEMITLPAGLGKPTEHPSREASFFSFTQGTIAGCEQRYERTLKQTEIKKLFHAVELFPLIKSTNGTKNNERLFLWLMLNWKKIFLEGRKIQTYCNAPVMLDFGAASCNKLGRFFSLIPEMLLSI